MEQAAELTARATLWVINPQSVADTARFKAKRAAPFVFLADEDLAVIHLYGIYHTVHDEHGPIPYPTTIVVKPDRTIAWRFLGLKARDRPAVQALLDALNAL
ncbi:MAG: redoxin domain-containing protein [Chloroflexi bacterium]|nr:redoxin domain-containing protein [Chloroflexota bacterium]